MKITIESTTKLITLSDGKGGSLPARIWEGKSASGVPVHVFITRITPTIPIDDPRQAEFQRELQEQKAPTAEMEAYPLRMIL